MLRNVTQRKGIYGSAKISVSKVHAPTLIALQGCGGVQFPEKKCYVTLEWSQNSAKSSHLE